MNKQKGKSMNWKIEKIIDGINSQAWGLCNSIEELEQEKNINMYDEIIEYLKEKRELHKEVK